MFETGTLFALLTIIGIDLVLAGDNAIVIGMASRNLPVTQRKKAILYEALLAILIRIGLTFIAIQLLHIPFLMAIGGLLLIYVAVKIIVGEKQVGEVDSPKNLYAAIKTIIVADLIMGIDNILAIAGASRGNFTLILIGLAVSIPIIIFASQVISNLMNKYPILVYLGAGIIGYTAAFMFLEDPMIQRFISQQYHMLIKVFSVILVLVIGRWRVAKRNYLFSKQKAS